MGISEHDKSDRGVWEKFISWKMSSEAPWLRIGGKSHNFTWFKLFTSSYLETRKTEIAVKLLPQTLKSICIMYFLLALYCVTVGTSSAIQHCTALQWTYHIHLLSLCQRGADSVLDAVFCGAVELYCVILKVDINAKWDISPKSHCLPRDSIFVRP